MLNQNEKKSFLRPIDIKRQLKVPYETVVSWLTVGHPRAGILPSIDLAHPGKRHSFRILKEDLQAFLFKLTTSTREKTKTKPLSKKIDRGVASDNGLFHY